MRYCPYCHAQLDKTDKFCGKCGRKIQKNNTKKNLGFLIVSALVIALSLLVIVSRSDSSDVADNNTESSVYESKQVISSDGSFSINDVENDENEFGEAGTNDVEDSEILVNDCSQAEMRVHFINVGQGDCTLVESKGQFLLIDAGPEDYGTKIQKYLNEAGVEKIDYLILTHPDSDHIGSADVIVSKYDIGKIYMNSYINDNRTYLNLLSALSSASLNWSIPSSTESFSLGDANVDFVWVKEYEDSNNSSICIKITLGDISFLFTGDAETMAESDMLSTQCNVSATVYHVAHHGSYSSSSDAFLNAVNPKYAVVSCGKENMYGHPHQETLDKLRNKNISLFRTDLQGTIISTVKENNVEWSVVPSGDYSGGSSELEKAIQEANSEENKQNSITKDQRIIDFEPDIISDSTLSDENIQKSIPIEDDSFEKSGQSDVSVGQDYKYIGNVTNKKLHRVDCKGRLPKESNRVYFYTLDEAIEAGYTEEEQCHNCYPFTNSR